MPDEVYSLLKRAAYGQGRSLNAQVIHILTLEAEELARRASMRASRNKLERFVASLPRTGSSVPLIRKDRER